jgi:hypothetical protein
VAVGAQDEMFGLWKVSADEAVDATFDSASKLSLGYEDFMANSGTRI